MHFMQSIQKRRRYAGEPRLGGVLCRYCKHLDPPAMAISPRTLKLLRLFGRLDLRRLGNVDVRTKRRPSSKIMRALMDMQLGLRLKSQNFLDQMDKYNI